MTRWSLWLAVLLGVTPALARAGDSPTAPPGAASAVAPEASPREQSKVEPGQPDSKSDDAVEDDDDGDDDDSASDAKAGEESSTNQSQAGEKKASSEEGSGVHGDVQLLLGGGTTQTTPANPRTGDLTATLSGSIEPSDKLSIDWSAGLTHDNKTAAQTGDAFGTSGANIFAFSLGPTWTPNDHWTASLEGNYSPKSTEYSDAQLQLDAANKQVTTDALLHSVSGSEGASVTATYDTAGDSKFESSVDVEVAYSHLSTSQNIVEEAGKNDKVVELSTYYTKNCQGAVEKKTQLCRRVASLLQHQTSELNQVSLGASYTATLFENTDVELGGQYYLYDQNPTQVGYFSVATVGRSSGRVGTARSSRSGEFDFGGGLPLEPLSYGISGGVAQTFGSTGLKVALNGGWGNYYDNTGYTSNLGLKVTYKLNKRWKFTLILSGSRDVDSDGNVTPSGNIAVGAKYYW